MTKRLKDKNILVTAAGQGIGKATAEWMIKGHINEDIFCYDIKRFQKFHSNLGFIKERITESLGDLYGMHCLLNNTKHLEILKHFRTIKI